MIISLIAAIAISLFAVGAGIILLWRFRDWRFGFLAGLALFAAAWVLANQLIQLSGETGGLSGMFADYERAFPTLVLSILTLSVMFFLERIIRSRTEAHQTLKLAQISLERANIPVIWFEPDGQIRYVNYGAREFLGYSQDELLSMSIRDVAPIYTSPDWERDWSSLKDRGSISTELNFSTKDGQLVPVDLTAIYVGSKGRDLGCMFVRDITARKKAEADLHIAMSEVKSANQAKSEFLATMSHELRTPLNSIIGFAEIITKNLSGPNGNPQCSEFAVDIRDSGRHLLALINDILDFSKIEASASELFEEEIDVVDLLTAVERMLRQQAERDGIELMVHYDEILPGLRGDERKIKQILVNLLTNAIKFTNSGGTVTIKTWCRAESGFVFQVIDTGIGIAAKDIPRALSQFGQIDSNLSREYEGTGLGLPLSKALIELHGGSLDLQSQVGVGTIVTVRFPSDRIIQPVEQVAANLTA